MMVRAVDIELLGKIYQVNCPEGQERSLQNARDRLEQKMQELKQKTKVPNVEKIAVIAALNFSYELGEEINRNNEYTESVDDRIKTLQESVDLALLKVDT